MASQFESPMTTVGGAADSVQPTVEAVTLSNPTSTTLTVAQSSTPTATPSSSNGITKMDTSVVKLTPTAGNQRPYSSTYHVGQATLTATTEHEMKSSKAFGWSLSTSVPVASERTATSTSNDISPLTGQDTKRTSVAGGNGGEQTTAQDPKGTTIKNTVQPPGSTTTKGFASTSSASAAGDGQDRTPPSSAVPSTLRDSTVTTNSSPTTTKTNGPYPSVAPTEGNDAATTTRVYADNTATPPPSSLLTEPMLGGGQNEATMSTVDNRRSTTQSKNDPKHHSITCTNVNALGERSDGSPRTTATTTVDSSVDNTEMTSNAGGDESTPHQTTRIHDAIGSEHTTTSVEGYLENIKLDLSLDFELDALTDEQLKNFEDLSKAYGLDVSVTQTFPEFNRVMAI